MAHPARFKENTETMKKILSGNEAIALGAYENGVKFASAYPGTPSTEILENYATYDGVYAEWAPNEKVAMEVAVGASMTGARVMTTMKHVGLNVAADPFMTLTYTGVEGGFLMVCADDPGMHSSQNEQDNRYYAKFAQIPMLEPSDSQESKDMVAEAYKLSESFDTPAMIRMTTRISHSKGIVEYSDQPPKQLSPEGFKRNLKKHVMIPAYAKLKHPEILVRMEKLSEYAETSPYNKVEMGDTKVGIISSGISYQHVKEIMPEASVLKLGMTYPLPEKQIRKFAESVDRLFVVEELEPFIEEHVRGMGIPVEGKKYFSLLDELSPRLVAKGFKEAGVYNDDIPDTIAQPEGTNMPRPPLMCAGCTHRGLFFALKKMKGIVHGDIGCYTLSVLPPIEAIDTTLCMGGSISMAHGTAKANEKVGIEDKRPVFAVIGDSTFFHSGITGLIDVIYNKSNVNVCILDNRITAMTGAQQNPGTGKTLQMEDTISINIEALCKSLGAERVRIVDPFDLDGTISALKEEAEFNGPSIIITERPCVQLLKKLPKEVHDVDPNKCIGCRACLRLGCPALSQGDEILNTKSKKPKYRAVIDTDICCGCSLCSQVCKSEAIYKV